MKKIAWFVILSVALFGVGGSLLAYEGGTKLVATMTHPERGQNELGPIAVMPHSEWSGTKLVAQFLHRMPQPTLSTGQLREEKLGPSTGTKGIVRFREQKWF